MKRMIRAVPHRYHILTPPHRPDCGSDRHTVSLAHSKACMAEHNIKGAKDGISGVDDCFKSHEEGQMG